MPKLFKNLTPFPVSPKGEMINFLFPPWGKVGMGVNIFK
jgi:hypothetical protein